MVRDNADANVVKGNEKAIEADDVKAATLDKDRWVPIWEQQSTKSLKYFPGYGVGDRRGQAGYSDLDLTATGNGTGTAGDNINCELRWEVYNDANQDDPAAFGPYFTSGDLRAAVSEDRTNKTLTPMQRIGAPEDGYLVLAAKVKDSQDGVETQASVDTGMAYTLIRA